MKVPKYRIECHFCYLAASRYVRSHRTKRCLSLCDEHVSQFNWNWNDAEYYSISEMDYMFFNFSLTHLLEIYGPEFVRIRAEEALNSFFHMKYGPVLEDS